MGSSDGTGTGSDPIPGEVARDHQVHDLVDLYRKYERRIYRVCLWQLRNSSDAEDAVQETFSRAAPQLGRMDRDPGGYLVTIARNVCRDELQRRSKCISLAEAGGLSEIEGGHVETDSIDRQDLNAAWARLTGRERELIGRRFAGFSYEEIAAQLCMTTGALNIALNRARKRARGIAGRSLTGVLALFVGPRLAGRVVRKMTQPGTGATALPTALMAATAVTCAVIGATGGGWFGSRGGPAASASWPVAGFALHGATIAPPAGPSGGSSAVAGTGSAGSDAGPGVGTQPAPLPDASVGGVTSSVLTPGQGSNQQDASFTSLTQSPGYQRDHTVFASGSLVGGCARPSCPVLFRTADGGATWQFLKADGFLGGAVLLAPDYPTNPTIFTSGPAGLQRSDNGGDTFTTVVPGAAPAAIDPSSPPDAARILIGSQIPLLYSQSTGKTSPGPALPGGVTLPNDVAFGRDGDMLFAASQFDPLAPAGQDGVVVRCPGGSGCVETLVRPGVATLALRTSPTIAVDNRVVVWSTRTYEMSQDGGATFSPLTLTGGQVSALALAPTFASTRSMVVAEYPGASSTARLLVSADGGASFTPVQLAGALSSGIATLAILPDGRQLAALSVWDGASGVGIRCSSDGGSTWATGCAPR